MLHNILKDKKLVLASASPRRSELLKLMSLNFIKMPANVDETIHKSDHLNPKRYVERISQKKCEAIKKQMDNECTIIAADTTVYLDKNIFGKPHNHDEARAFLTALSDKTHIAVHRTNNRL
jgi:septum formation protein